MTRENPAVSRSFSAKRRSLTHDNKDHAALLASSKQEWRFKMGFFSDRSKDEKKTMFLAAVQMAMADGHLDPKESAWCFLIAARIGLTESEVKSVIDNPTSVNLTIPKSKKERALNLIELIHVSESDGDVSPEELKVL
ncbi:MAG: TerB family tellurite resistance protein, partial [Phycisphaera sp. TMED9]